MLGSYVCRRCRAHISQCAPSSRTPQNHGRATFISLARNTTITSSEAAPQPSPEKHIDAPAPLKIPHLSLRPLQRQLKERVTGSGRYAKYSPGLDSKLESREGQDSRDVEPGLIRYQTGKDFTHSKTRRWPSLQKPIFKSIAEQLLNDGHIDIDTFRRHGHDAFALFDYGALSSYLEGKPVFASSPTEALATVAQRVPLDEVNVLLSHVIWKSTLKLLEHGSGKETTGLAAHVLFAELLSAWKLLFQLNGQKKSKIVEGLDPEWNLPSPDFAPVDIVFRRNFAFRLAEYHPKYRFDMSVSYSAITIFNILRGDSRYKINIKESSRKEAEPFFRALSRAVDGADMSKQMQYWDQLQLRLPDEYKQILKEEILSAPDAVLGTLGSGNEVEATLLKRIARAVQEHTHKERLDRLWQQTLQTYTKAPNKTTIPIPIYNAFLDGYLALYAGDSSLEVWNHMIAQGIKPDVTSWTALLTGCGKARDLDGLNIMWERMRRSGVQPDVYAWTSRIHGLISLRQVTAGFAAMDEMGTSWQAAEQPGTKQAKPTLPKSEKKKHVPSNASSKPPKPTTEVVNGAISAVVSIRDLQFSRKAEFAQRILRWASSLSIPPDARTYNILIQLYLRGNDLPTALGLVDQMEADGLEPDIVTYTMLLRAAFDNEEFYGLSPSEQTAHVTDIFSRLEAAGLKLNSWTYSSTIDKLLKEHGNMAAVKVIVDHMVSRGMAPTVHVYTSLITHYFQQSPPNIEAVDRLWFQLNERPGQVPDRVLFDRIVEGYASVGEIGKMIAVLTKMSAMGKLPSWVTLTAVVKALGEAGEWDRARGVVRDVQNGEGVAKGGMRVPTHGMQEFKILVRKYGLVETEEELEMYGVSGDMPEEHDRQEAEPNRTNA